MLANERLLDIEAKFAEIVEKVVLLEAEGETLKTILFLKDNSNLRVTEQWEGDFFKRYSYYWLSSENKLIIGWDNVPHHTKLKTFPHHRHVTHQKNLGLSNETCLEDVINFIKKSITFSDI